MSRKHDIYEAPESAGAVTNDELAGYAARTKGVFIFVMIGVIGGISGREHYGLFGGLTIAGVCIVIASLLALSSAEQERCDS